jgi:hypothetical protein
MVFGFTRRLCHAFGLLLLATTLLLPGCSKSIPRKHCVLVSGQVLLQGKPLPGALVVFYPVDKSDENSLSASGTTDVEGKFVLSTYDSGDGAPPGEYGIAITKSTNNFKRKELNKKKEEPDQLNDRYKTPKTSNLRAKVEDKPSNELPPFKLD